MSSVADVIKTINDVNHNIRDCELEDVMRVLNTNAPLTGDLSGLKWINLFVIHAMMTADSRGVKLNKSGRKKFSDCIKAMIKRL